MGRVDLDWAEGYLTGRATGGLGHHLGIDVTLALVAELGELREVIEAAETASAAVERLVNQLSKGLNTWDHYAISAWDATQALQQALSLYHKGGPAPSPRGSMSREGLERLYAYLMDEDAVEPPEVALPKITRMVYELLHDRIVAPSTPDLAEPPP